MPFFPFVIYSVMMVSCGLTLEYLLSMMKKQTNKIRKTQMVICLYTINKRAQVDAHCMRTDPGGLYESICNQVIWPLFLL